MDGNISDFADFDAAKDKQLQQQLVEENMILKVQVVDITLKWFSGQHDFNSYIE